MASDRQIEMARAYAEAHGLTLKPEFVEQLRAGKRPETFRFRGIQAVTVALARGEVVLPSTAKQSVSMPDLKNVLDEMRDMNQVDNWDRGYVAALNALAVVFNLNGAVDGR